jgi:endonuclease/exonuclease/phosphatase family metal-dependent hydrolase
MVPKLVLAGLFIVFFVAALVLQSPPCACGSDVKADAGGTRLRLMSWNIGNGDLETETRAHTDDLGAVAKVILDNSADVVALQELSGQDQLKVLLKQLNNGYRGYVCGTGSGDRVDGVLIKKLNRTEDKPDFADIPAAGRFAASATFRWRENLPEIAIVSAHADAFNAERRRRFVDDVVDWTRNHPKSGVVFIAGDFNLEVSTRNKNNLFADDAKHDSESYSYLLKYFRDLGLNAGETSINDRRIDYIFGPPTAVRLHRAEVLREASVGQMDHWPLLVEVSF